MYFGTKERAIIMRDPSAGAGYNAVGFSDKISYLNGGVGTRNSKGSHLEFDMAWSVITRDEIGELEGYSQGLYGDGLIYFVDPVAADRNLFSAQWASPKLTAEDGIPLAGTVRPEKVLVGDTGFGYPLYGAAYQVTAATPRREFYIPLPDGHTAWIGAHGLAQAQGLQVQPTSRGLVSGPVLNVPVQSTSDPERFSVSVVGSAIVDGISIMLDTSAAATITLAGLMLQVLPTGIAPTAGSFLAGRGNSGCTMSKVNVTPYYLPNEVLGAVVKLTEVGDWL